ncbi:glucokinase [Bradyrhizobium sp. Arg237L]|uniref:glucokinase n=1 Tax=Bradyrhizobium sp. Arg237L TaxID=3003352 RepID=UPI00249E3B80|nr:glucokinase [Bradyrhizobium sp. Arg237L]MDI4239169.1 glucokinase [Bradyrhizobium sp. Arg237L]
MTGISQALLADIGGTNARFALVRGGQIGPIEHVKVADYPTSAEAIAAFLARHTTGGVATVAIFGIAGPIENNRVVLTNSPWMFDAASLRQQFAFAAAHFLNDFEALAWSLPALGASDLVSLGSPTPVAGAPMLVVGPGTGFGASCLVPSSKPPVAIITEAGHATLPATSEREERVIDHLRGRFGHVSIERALSGSGLTHLYDALNAIDGAGAPARDAASITQAALDGSCATSGAALDMFCAMLGMVCGNLALTFGARGGVYIAGGIVPRFVDHLAGSDFGPCFTSKGRFDSYLREIPVHVITRPDVTFVGLKAFFETNVMAA